MAAPSTVANVALLRERGAHIVGPGVGALTGSDVGPGRMAEPEEILAAALAAVRPQDLAGRRILVTAGARESRSTLSASWATGRADAKASHWPRPRETAVRASR
ncbi:hypothetical protein GCM10025866_28890 [Naasia aerilata]|uniref:Uncharacterized protein n=1 Tax=Naasia aerilata TaxID=1162966 RepID=A0ABN6XTL6_9MICO|nr:hypothetical protein GCM10025866_28890 [Naasia aerilata]